MKHLTNRKFSTFEQHQKVKRNERILSIIVFIVVAGILIGMFLIGKIIGK